MLESNRYEYNFEIETILQQFISIIDNALVMRYSVNKESGERELDEVIKPGYILGTKQRVMLDIISKAKNYELPVVIISLSGISFVKERQASKNQNLQVSTYYGISDYARPTPISIKVDVTIMTKYMTDLYQIYGKLATQFQPAVTYSWFVPQIIDTNWVELRNKIEWDGELNLDVRTESKSSDEDKFTGKLGFTIDGWLFPKMNGCAHGIIFDIGTTVVPNEDTLSRIYDEISLFRPLVHTVMETKEWMRYNNPRQFATAHPTITSVYKSHPVNNTQAFFVMDKERSTSLPITKDCEVTINGYNFKDCKVLAIPEQRGPFEGLESYTKKYNNSLHPFPNTLEEKHDSVSGYVLNILKQTDNKIIVDFKDTLKFSGPFDIAVVNDIDYDLISERKGFKLHTI
ncbi:MAG: tail sheath stabilizer and completion protein [Lachnospiraceae bacterium]|nr:tail sheath stabilizer and completion protein [Lachnospiraceae bacterium]